MDIRLGLILPLKEAGDILKGRSELAGWAVEKPALLPSVGYLINVQYRLTASWAVTFTNKAAREMEERLKALVSNSVDSLTLGTFHAICARILRREGKAIGIDPGFIIYDDEDQLFIKRIQELNLDPKKFVPRQFFPA
jgi:superfamily I DNA/RNA helicase